MIDYTQSESADLEGAGWLQSDATRLSGVEDYQEWAVQMQHYAAQVKNTERSPDLVIAARTLASNSGAIVFLRSIVLGQGDPLDEDPPPHMDDYNYEAYKVDAAVDLLNYECPR